MKEIDWSAVIDWFGYVPEFHDAELPSVDLRAAPEPSVVKVHAFRMTDEVDDRGYFKLDKHALVTFTLTDLVAKDMDDLLPQNILMSLTIAAVPEGLRMWFEDVYSVDAWVIARDIEVSLEPWTED